MKRTLAALAILAATITTAEASRTPNQIFRASYDLSSADNIRPAKDDGYLRHGAWGSKIGSNTRPRKWCGWYMRQHFGGGPAYNVAWNWVRRGVPSAPHVGAIVVWRHHVGVIVGQSSRGWIVQSGNDGGRVRARVRSLRNAVVRSI